MTAGSPPYALDAGAAHGEGVEGVGVGAGGVGEGVGKGVRVGGVDVGESPALGGGRAKQV